MKRISVRFKNGINTFVFAIPLALMALVAFYFEQESGANPFSKSTKVGKDVLFFVEDPTNALEIEDVSKTEFPGFQPSTTDVPNFGFSPNNVWLKFKLQGNWNNGEQMFVEIKNPILNEVQVFAKHGNQTWEIAHTGDNYPFATRPVEHTNYIIPFEIPFNEEYEVYMKLNCGGEQFLAPITIWNKEGLADRDSKDILFKGSYFGIIIFVLLFNLFIYLVIRERSSMYYVHYNLNLLFLQLCLGGFAFRYFWPNSPYLANVANPFFASMGILALIRFSQSFLNLKQIYPKLNRIFKWVGVLVMINALVSFIYNDTIFQTTVLVINSIALVLNIIIFPVGWKVMKQGFQPARYFLLGFVILILTVFVFILTNFGVLQNELLANYGLQIGSSAEVILLSFAVVDRFKSFKQKALEGLQEINRLEREQNVILEHKVEERTHEINKQKEQILFQNEEIISSIRYAQRIQRTFLPSDEQLRRSLEQSFVMYKPKDIVSGDFYWVHDTVINNQPHVVFALADCTGHGVPGALMSVMGQNLLKQSVQELEFPQPNLILNLLNKKVVDALSQQTGYEHASDGMDISVYTLNKVTLLLQFAGANNGLHIVRNGEIIELSGDKKAIGTRGEDVLFTHHEFQLQTTDFVYATTDGMRDQFGGEKGKKLKSTGLREWFIHLATLDIREQKHQLEIRFADWMGHHEQIDDVCVMGLRV
jgi:serine phosphatase RsbU (regulator of sigma subunit)